MPWIVTPSQLSARAELYHQLHQLLNAGIGLIEALQVQRRSPPARSHRAPLSELIRSLTDGATLAEAVATTGPWMPSFDAALLRAGEESGQLPECFRLLAEFYRDRASILRRMIADLLYPLLLLHFAVFIPPIPTLFQPDGSIVTYLFRTLGILLPLYAITLALLSAAQSNRSESWRSLVESVTNAIPILGRARRNLALARLSAALEALVRAGVPIIEGWSLAAMASGSPALRRAVAAWKPQLAAGQTPSEAVTQSRPFPELFANMYHTGEISGQLDESLHRLHVLYREEGTRQLHALAQWVPKILYFLLIILIAYSVISSYSNLFKTYDQLIP